MEEKQKRSRSANFTEDEKKVVLEYVKMHVDIMENKSNDVAVFKRKRQGWQEISDALKSYGFIRDPKIIKELYHRLKSEARKNIIRYKSEKDNLNIAKRCKSPSEFDWQVYQICPSDFDINSNTEVKLANLETIPCITPEPEIISTKIEMEEMNQLYLPECIPVETNNIGSYNNNEIIEPKTPSPSPKISKKSESKKKQMTSYETELLKLYAKESDHKIKQLKEVHEKQMKLQEEQLVLVELKKQKQQLKILKLKKELSLL